MTFLSSKKAPKNPEGGGNSEELSPQQCEVLLKDREEMTGI